MKSFYQFATKPLKCTKQPILYKMQTAPISVPLGEFRANASAMIDLVEKGETVRILRHGKPVAELVPMPVEAATKVPSWKRPFEPVVLSAGASLSQAVLDERNEEPW